MSSAHNVFASVDAARSEFRRLRNLWIAFRGEGRTAADFNRSIRGYATQFPAYGPEDRDGKFWIRLAECLVEQARMAAMSDGERKTLVREAIEASVGRCLPCAGTGRYRPTARGDHGDCYRCGGKGEQDVDDAYRNVTYDLRNVG